MAGNLATSGRIVLVATDLMRQSRVAEAARAAGYAVAVAATADEAREALRGDAGAVVILDLQAEGVPWRDVLAAAGATPVIAFGKLCISRLLLPRYNIGEWPERSLNWTANCWGGWPR